MKKTTFVAVALIAVLAVPCVSAQSAAVRAGTGIIRSRSTPAGMQSTRQSMTGRLQNAALSNQELQSQLEKQRQTLQMLSTISKQLHDTTMNVIRKIGG